MPPLTLAAPLAADYPLSLHDALPIWTGHQMNAPVGLDPAEIADGVAIFGPKPVDGQRAFVPDIRLHILHPGIGDRKSTRLNSSHLVISYADFCLKKKKLT